MPATSSIRNLKVGLVIDGTGHFVRPIEAELRRRHHVDRFTPRFVHLPLIGKRVNDWLLNKQSQSFMRQHDVVFFEWAGPLAAMASHQPGKGRRIVRIHRTEMFTDLCVFNWAAIDKVIFVSEAMRSRFVKQFPDQGKRTIVVHNGVSLDRFSVCHKPFEWRLGMLGNLIPRKRAYDVICALAVLPSDIPWQLFVGGAFLETELDYWDALKALVECLNLTQRIHFCGYIEDAAQWFRGINIFISASYSEGQQVSLIEAMASGCYCLSHCWDGAEEMLPQENIFTTDGDLRVKLLAYAALSETEKRQSQTQMRAIAEERFDERRMVQQIVEIIECTARR